MRNVLAGLAGAAAVAAGLSCAGGAPRSGYRADPSWPERPADVAWGEMPGAAVDGDGKVWIFTRAEPAVQVYDGATGALVRSWHPDGYGKAHHVRIGPEGNVWLADIGRHTVTKHAPDGTLLLTLGTPGEAGEDERRMDRPTDMAVAPSGDVFVSDGYGNNRIVHFDAEGNFVKAWGKKGTGPGEFDLPHGIDIDSRGRLYVADRSNGRIQVFDRDGTFLAAWEGHLVPWSVRVTPEDEIWTCGSGPTERVDGQGMRGIPPPDQVFMRFAADGTPLFRMSVPAGTGPGETAWVHVLAADAEGNLYAGDIKGRRVQKFAPAGR